MDQAPAPSPTALALALTKAAAQSDPCEDWAPTASADQADLPEDRASTWHLLRHRHQLYKEHHLR